MRVLIIGGAKFIGKRLVNRLLADGHEITLLHRTDHHDYDPRVRNAVADRNDGAAIRSALAGKDFKAVYDIAYDWKRGTTAGQVEDTVRAVPGQLSRYIFVSSSVVYRPGLDLRESDPLMSAEEAPNDYVRNKAESERMLFSLGDVPVVTVRPPYVYGPENPFYREAFFFDRLMLGRPIIIPGDGGRLLQFVYVDDLARAMVAMLSNPAAVGQAFNVAHTTATSQLELARTIRKVMGRRDVDAGLAPCPRRSSSATGATCSAAPRTSASSGSTTTAASSP